MNKIGLALCSRYAYPPNSLSLCGPEKQNDLSWYTTSGETDKGTAHILSQFTTLYPYLQLIASEHNRKDPFDPKVVEAYWIGNELLSNISMRSFEKHMTQSLNLQKKLQKKELVLLLEKLGNGGLPHHAFHVLNVWKRTGNVDSVHTLQTMEACLVQTGVVQTILADSLVVTTKPLLFTNDQLRFGAFIERTIKTLGKHDPFVKSLHLNDTVSYHWGRFVEKLSEVKAKRLLFFTRMAIDFANQPGAYEKNYLYFR